MHKSKNGYVKRTRNKVLLKHKFFSLSVKVKDPYSSHAQEMLDIYHSMYVKLLDSTKQTYK